eukprot:7019471-Prymnesium_polylepis.1
MGMRMMRRTAVVAAARLLGRGSVAKRALVVGRDAEGRERPAERRLAQPRRGRGAFDRRRHHARADAQP